MEIPSTAIAVLPVLILAIFPVMAYLTARVARTKGREFLPWLFIGLLFGPFGLLVAVALQPRSRQTA